MRVYRRIYYGVVTLIAVTLAACASRDVQLNQMEADELWDYAEQQYRERDWDDAIRGFQQFTFQHPTHPRAQEARYMLAESYLGDEQYITAAQEYARLADDFPLGPFADDARFKVCTAYERLSPSVELDQEYTRAALGHCQSLVDNYPDSNYVPEAREIIVRMRAKLARKLYIGGEYYFRRNAFDSAIIYYEDAVRSYPDTHVAPEALLRIVQSYERIGYAEEAEDARQRLLRAYPDSEAARLLQREVVNGS